MRGDKAVDVCTLSSSDADLRITSSIVAGERDKVEGIVVLTEKRRVAGAASLKVTFLCGSAIE